MCGIAGIYQLHGETVTVEVLSRMTQSIVHRGPDDEGHLLDGNLGLGSRRLSIIDLSAAGHMPMPNEDQRLWIVYNGEVYNYRELMPVLKQQGHCFRSQTDTEVILHSYEEQGAQCLATFNGMWAFAIWDQRTRTLFCARDRFGIKPFYYYFDGKVFIFASEIKAILLHPQVSRQVNDAVIYDYLATGIVDHTEETFFKQIHRLPAAHCLTLNAAGHLQITRWWDLPVATSVQAHRDRRATAEELRWLLKDAVRLCMRSDVPIGTSLSGGLDSSSVACLINQLLREDGITTGEQISRQQKTFSVCYEDRAIDERPFIEAVSQQIGAEKQYVFPTSEQFWQDLTDLITYQEEPFVSTSMYAQWNVMRLTAKHGVKVLLDGQGGDELFAGYPYHLVGLMAHLLRGGRLHKVLQEGLKFRIVEQDVPLFLLAALYQLTPAWALTPFQAWITAGRAQRSHSNVLNMAFQRAQQHRTATAPMPKGSPQRNLLGQQLYRDVTTAILPSLLRYEDKNSMAFSIEARVPLLDYRLAEFAFTLPPTYLIHNGWTKAILREAMTDLLPATVTWRRDKKGFPTPEQQWLRKHEAEIGRLFTGSDMRSHAYLNSVELPTTIHALLQNPSSDTKPVWRWLNLELWMRCYHL